MKLKKMILFFFMSSYPLILFAQSSFFSNSANSLSLELLGKGIRPGIYFERHILNNYSLILGISSFSLKKNVLPIDIAFPTYSVNISKYFSYRSAGWRYFEGGIGIYSTSANKLLFPNIAYGLCYGQKGKGLFIKAGLTNVYIFPFLHLNIGYRFDF